MSTFKLFTIIFVSSDIVITFGIILLVSIIMFIISLFRGGAL